MGAPWHRVLLLAAVVGSPAGAAEPPGPDALRLTLGDLPSLQQRLLAWADERLRPAGLSVDARHARMNLPRLPAGAGLAEIGSVDVRLVWPQGSALPPLPLSFELHPVAPQAGRSPALTITVAVPLLRDAWVATRKLARGSAVACTDLQLQRRDWRRVPPAAWHTACDLAPATVALRDIGARDVVRRTDLGQAPDVAAGSVVRLHVLADGIRLSTTAMALADARVGDLIDVRLHHPPRTFRTRVTAPGAVQLAEDPR